MSRQCAICGKRPISGHAISHAHNVSKRKWLPNLQRIRLEIDGKPRRAYVCSKCIKSGTVKKISARKAATPKEEV